jgi:hypothetical protein
MKKLKLRRRQGGWVLLMVLAMLLMLSLLVAGLFAASSEHQMTTRSISGQQVAVQRAEEGLQVALQAIRGRQITMAATTNYCNQPLAADCPAGDRHSLPAVDKGTTLDLREGGGLQYEYHVVRRQQPGAPIARFVVQSVGFYGYAGSRNLISAIVEADVDMGAGSGGLAGGGSSY